MLYLTYPPGYVPTNPQKKYDELTPDERKVENRKILLFIDERKNKLDYEQFRVFLQSYYDKREITRFTITTNEIKTYLNISDFFVKQHLAPNIDFIRKPKFLNGTDGFHNQNAYLWDREQLDKFLMNHCVYSAQTFLHPKNEIVFKDSDFISKSDFYLFKSKSFDEVLEAEDNRKEAILSDSFYERYGMDPCCTQRGFYRHYKLNPISFWDKKYSLFPANQTNRTPELFYREMFSEAAIKVVFSGNKTFFLVRDFGDQPVNTYVSTIKPKVLL